MGDVMAKACIFLTFFLVLGGMSGDLRGEGLLKTSPLERADEYLFELAAFASPEGTLALARPRAAPTYRLAEARDAQGELLNTPVYDPNAKSYFEMVDGSHGMVQGPVGHEGPNWREAYQLSQRRNFKGSPGRLAIVTSLETHEFLLRTFRPKTQVWIGLRYWCSTRKLQWSDGEMVKPGSFQAWAKEWKQDVYACSSDGAGEFMPVAYSPLPTFAWIGKGWAKRFYYFFVEYPTGRE